MKLVPLSNSVEQINSLLRQFSSNLASIWSNPVRTSTLDSTLHSILQNLLRNVDSASLMSAAAYVWYDGIGLQPSAAVGPLASYMQSYPPRNEGTISYVLRTKNSLFVSDATSLKHPVPDISEQAKLAGVKAFINIPLMVQHEDDDQLVGVLVVNFQTEVEISAEFSSLLTVYVECCSAAILHAQIHWDYLQTQQKLRESEEHFERLSSSLGNHASYKVVAEQLLHDLGKIVQYESASLQLINGEYRIQVAGTGFDSERQPNWLLPWKKDALIRDLIETGKVKILSNTEEADEFNKGILKNVKSWIGMPIKGGDTTLGILTVDHPSPGFYPNEEGFIDLLNHFAAYAGRTILSADPRQAGELTLKEFLTVGQLAAQIAQEQTIEKIMQLVVDGIVRNLQCNHCTFFQAATKLEGKVWLVPTATADQRTDKRGVQRVFSADETSIAGVVFRTGNAERLLNARANPDFALGASDYKGPMSMLVCPLIIDNNVIGVVSADHDAYGWFLPRHQRFVEALLAQASIGVKRARSLERLLWSTQAVAQTDNERTLIERILKDSVELVKGDAAILYVINHVLLQVEDTFCHPANCEFPSPDLTSDEDITAQVIINRQTLIINAARDDKGIVDMMSKQYYSAVIAPIFIEATVLGVLHIYCESYRQFTPFESMLISTYASNAAIALENVRKKSMLEDIAFNRGIVIKELQEGKDMLAESMVRSHVSSLLTHTLNHIHTQVSFKIQEAVTLINSGASSEELRASIDNIREAWGALDKALETLKKKPQFSIISASEILDEIQRRALAFTPSTIEKRWITSRALPDVLANTAYLRTALWNLIQNAVEAMGNTGALTIKGSVIQEGGYDKWIEILVSDTGPGISESNRERVFENGFSTKLDDELGHDGFGLFQARNLIALCGGSLAVQNSSSTGTTMRILLPIIHTRKSSDY